MRFPNLETVRGSTGSNTIMSESSTSEGSPAMNSPETTENEGPKITALT